MSSEPPSEAPRAALEEPLELLLPRDAERAHRVANFARLLVADARRAPLAAGADELERARGELARQTRCERREVLQDLLRHHLRAHFGGESFLALGQPRLTLAAAWRAELERERGGLAPPAPGESALSVAERVVAAGEACELDTGTLALWGAWLERASHGARAGEARFVQWLAAADDGTPLALRRSLLTGLVECLLDRGAVREAQVRLADAGRAVHGDRRAHVLAGWCAVLLEDQDGARAALAEQRPWDEELPEALAELRQRLPESLSKLTGRAPLAPVGELDPGPAARRELGASVLAVFERGPAASARPRHAEAAPGLRSGLRSWLEEREGALMARGWPEQRLMLEACPVRLFPAAGEAPKSALGGARTRALLLEPLLDGEGELVGWLHVECEHRLLPTPRRARALARGLVRELPESIELQGDRSGAASSEGLGSAGRVSGRAAATARFATLEPPAYELVAEVFEALVGELKLRTQARRCVGVDLSQGEPRLAGEFGEGLGAGEVVVSSDDERPGEREGARSRGGGRALARALEAGGVAGFDEPDARLSLHPEAASGIVLPLRLRERTIGALSIESSRRRDFRGVDLERLSAIAQVFAPALRAAQFRAHHLARHESDLFLDTSQPGFRLFAEQIAAAGRSNAPVVLCGEAGTGRTALARWVHFEGAAAGACLATLSEAGATGRPDPLERRRSVERGFLVEELEQRSEEEQRALHRHLEAGGGPLTIVTSRAPLADSLAKGVVLPALAARLSRMELFVPALRERREEFDGLLEFLLTRFAAEERARAPRLTDGARALLWRQAWHGNLRELEAFAFKLVLMHAGEEVSDTEVKALARRFRLPLVARLPSRHPERRELVAALRATLLGSQRINKRRAALYLGWDPDTLAARVREAGLDESALEDEPAPWAVPWE